MKLELSLIIFYLIGCLCHWLGGSVPFLGQILLLLVGVVIFYIPLKILSKIDLFDEPNGWY